MLVCSACHRHHRDSEQECPFCHVASVYAPAPLPAKLGAMALVMGLGLLGCGGDDGDSGETTSDTSETAGTDTGTDTTTDTTDSGGSDYGGAPPLPSIEEPERDRQAEPVEPGPASSEPAPEK